MRTLIKRLLTPPLMLLAALIMFTEEVLWEFLKRLMADIGRLPLIRSLEARVATLPPYAAAAVFMVPGAALLPVKISALWLMGNGYAVLGACVIVAAKLLGTALVARIFTLTKPQLMTLNWFAWTYNTIMRWRAVLYGWVIASGAWQRVENLRAHLRAWAGRWKPGRIGARLRAIQRLRRRSAFR